ncbi:MAG: recombinase family protein [Chloroflexi bacterium]|nr:recombinase family protein [Chloroflexota bacterium]
MRRVALYARVSTRHQEQEATIESQIDQLLTYAEAQGYELAPEHQFIDQAVSGVHLARPALDRLRDAAAAGAFDMVLFLSPDRLARKLGVQWVVLDELSRENVDVIFLNQPALDDSPQAKLMLNMLGAYYEFDRTRISDQLRRGRLYRLRQGLSVPHQAPYGYRYQPATPEHSSTWIVVPEQAVVVQQVFAWYTEEVNLSLDSLAHRLNEQKTVGPAGGLWNTSTLGRMLRQPAYKGAAYYSRHQTDYSGVGRRRRQGQGTLRYPRYKLRPAEEWIEISVPPLVDEATWQAAQERLQMNARFAQRNSRRTYLLRGLLVCGTCGHTLQGSTQSDTVYYRCVYGGVRCPPGVPRHTCSVRGDVAEPLILQALAELLRDPQRIQDDWEALQAEQAATPSETSRWQQRQTLLRKQRQRLLDAYQIGVISLKEFTERQNPPQIELRELEKRLGDTLQPTPLQISLETFTQRIEQALRTSDVKTRQEVLRLLIERIAVTDEALTVEHIVPTVNNVRLHPTFCET